MKDRTIITKYNMKEIFGYQSLGIRIALVTDLHDRDPRPVLRLLKQSRPDLILAAGDIMERNEEGYEGHSRKEINSYQQTSRTWAGFCKFLRRFHQFLNHLGLTQKSDSRYGSYFLKKASQLAPLYYEKGNHEWYLLPEDYELIKQCGITLLDNEDCSVEIKGKRLRIGGLSTIYDLDWLEEYAKKDGTKILLCHHPEYYERYVVSSGLDFDLLVSGHAHGGQWRFFGHGILSPGQGLFPKYHHGVYGKMIVSAGVSNTLFVPRFGNPCELVLIEL